MVVERRSKECFSKKEGSIQNVLQNWVGRTQNTYWKMRNQIKKVIAKAIKTEAEKEMEEFREKPNKIFKFVKLMKRDGKDVEGGKWIKGRDGRIGFSQED